MTGDVIRHDVTFEVGTREVRVSMFGRLEWSADEAPAVTVVFHDSHRSDPVYWTVAREELRKGLIVPSGGGDVHIEPDYVDGVMSVRLRLSSPDGVALVWMPSAVLRRFLHETEKVVPARLEAVDIDAVIARCLEGSES